MGQTPQELRRRVSGPLNDAPREGVLALWLGAGLAVLVFGPWLRLDSVLLLDYGLFPGGRDPHLPEAFWGFPPDLVSRAPVDALILGLVRLVPAAVIRLVPLLAAPLVSAWGFSRILPGNRLALVGATIMYVVNPFVYERLAAGQVYVVLGYAILPGLLAAVLNARVGRQVSAGILAGTLLVLAIALQIHFLFIGTFLLAAAAVAGAITRRREILITIAIAVTVTAALSTYWVIAASPGSDALQAVDKQHLSAFRTTPDESVGLMGNVASLYGFWRTGEFPLPKEAISAWPLLLLAIAVVGAEGVRVAWKQDRMRALVITLAIAATCGLLLGMGDQGPTGGVFIWLFETIPGFRIMREPQKFVGLLALSYAVFFGIGLQSIAESLLSRRSRIAAVALLIAIPAVYGHTLLWGLNGRVHPSSLPRSWAEADAEMGDGRGSVLILPWHLYISYPFTGGRRIANPLADYFRRDSVAAHNVELPQLQTQSTDPRNLLLDFVLSQETQGLGEIIATLGVEYIALAKSADWLQFSWVRHQPGLLEVREWNDLILIKNLEYVGRATVANRATLARDWGEVVVRAQGGALTGSLIEVARAEPGSRSGASQSSTGSGRSVEIVDESPVHVRYGSLPNRGYLLTDRVVDDDWTLAGDPPLAHLSATAAFTLGRTDESTIEFTHWRLVRLGYIVGTVNLIAAVTTALVLRRRRLPHHS